MNLMTTPSDPDPGCLEMDANDKDSGVSTQLGGPILATFLNLESIFENTCLEDLVTAIDFNPGASDSIS